MLSIAILTYKDDVIFTSLLIIYLLCIIQWPIHWHNDFIYGTLLPTYTFIKAFGN